jgi:hypothetical protein
MEYWNGGRIKKWNVGILEWWVDGKQRKVAGYELRVNQSRLTPHRNFKE